MTTEPSVPPSSHQRATKSYVFSKIDFRFGYHQDRVDQADVYTKTAFRTSYGDFAEFRVLPCGLINAPATFIMALVRGVFTRDLLEDIVIVFDDIFVCGNDEAKHEEHLSPSPGVSCCDSKLYGDCPIAVSSRARRSSSTDIVELARAKSALQGMRQRRQELPCA